jgi:cytochrome c oxidase assembly factor 1
MRPRLPPTPLFRPPLRRAAAKPTHTPTRTLIAAPKPNSGPLLSRRPDRALPSLTPPRRWLRSLPLFFALIAGSTAAIFNYQKQSSSVTTSTLYALRTNPEARAILGDEIYFASQIPWISGELNQLHGRIDISFGVKGTRGRGRMRFRSERRGRRGFVSCHFSFSFLPSWWLGCVVWRVADLFVCVQFETLEWSLTTEDGGVVQLYKPEGPDPFKRIAAGEDEEKYTH